MTGTRVGSYHIHEKLGQGGMGVVFRAEDTRLRRNVAIKFLPERYASDHQALERFQREARLASSLNHPNICTVHDIGDSGGRPYLVMEYLEGQSLDQRLLQGPIEIAEALDLAIEIADALDAAHARGIVHRDIKAPNIFLTARGRAKVLDFGIAKLREEPAHSAEEIRAAGERARDIDTRTRDREKLTTPGMALGTVAYMSPEQARGQDLDHRTDLFSFGVTLYEMITGARAFRGASTAEVFGAILYETPPPVGRSVPGAPAELDRIVQKSLEKDRELRYQSAADLRGDLRRLKRDLSSMPAARLDPAPLPSAPLARSWKRKVLLGAEALLVVAALAVIADRWLRPPEPPPRPGFMFSQVTFQQGPELFPSVAPDGASVVYASNAAGNWDIYLHAVGEKSPMNLTSDSRADDTQPAFSPDGASIAFRSERDGGGIYVMERDGRSPRKVTSVGFNPAWSPDGREILCATESIARPDDRLSAVSQVWAIRVSSGAQRLISKGDAVQASWSPNGFRVAYWASRGGQRDIWTVRREGAAGEAVPVTNDPAVDWNPVWAPDGRHLYFSSDRGGKMELWRVAIDERSGEVLGAPEAVVTPSPDVGHISFSRDGRTVAFSSHTFAANLMRVAFDPEAGRVDGAPAAITQGAKQATRPDLSPDGQWLAYNSFGKQDDLFVVRTDGTGLRQLTDDAHKDRGPRWSPDGKRLAFFSNRSGNYEIWTVHPDGGGLAQLTQSPQVTAAWPVWSPDGRRMLYTIFGRGSFLVDPTRPWQEQSPRPLPAPGDRDETFSAWSWSPDGSKIAGFQQRADGVFTGLYVYSFQSQEYQKVTDAGLDPVWLPGSRRLLYHHDGRLHLADTASAETREVLSVAPAEVARRGFSVSRDGRAIYFSETRTEADVWLMTVE